MLSTEDSISRVTSKTIARMGYFAAHNNDFGRGWRWSPIQQLTMIDLMLTCWRYLWYTFAKWWGGGGGGEKRNKKHLKRACKLKHKSGYDR